MFHCSVLIHFGSLPLIAFNNPHEAARSQNPLLRTWQWHSTLLYSGLNALCVQLFAWRAWLWLRFGARKQLRLLSATANDEAGSVRVRWRVLGFSHSAAVRARAAALVGALSSGPGASAADAQKQSSSAKRYRTLLQQFFANDSNAE